MDELNARPPSPPELEDRILPWSQVKVISGLSRTTVWRLQKTGDFPASVQVSPNRVGWWQSEILEWRRSRLPRRLPEPRRVPKVIEDRPEPTTRLLHGAPTRTTQVEASDPVEAAGPVRKRRKPSQCQNQTAFDF
ncbi:MULTISPECIES: helix-turn-helix transcriptional regulator [Brevundimonas]|uniref:helix-turn-helix transcriptional regulator n=1 Tax=Brevundimonas TaxID=41275 RepID=UPI0034D4B15A